MRLFLNLSATRNHLLRYSSSFKQQLSNEETHATRSMYLWKRISVFIAIPVVSYLTWKNLIAVEEHHEKREYTPWSHLRIRNKPFPWKDSDKTLFHNSLTNPGPNDNGIEEGTPKISLLKKIGLYWQSYLFEDPIKRDEERERHLRQMQRRHEDYLKKKAIPEGHIQPGDLVAEFNATPKNRVDELYNTS